MDEMLKIIGNVGFPIAVAAFLLVRVEQRMDNLTAARSNSDDAQGAGFCCVDFQPQQRTCADQAGRPAVEGLMMEIIETGLVFSNLKRRSSTSR